MNHTSRVAATTICLLFLVACAPGGKEPGPEPVTELTPAQAEEIRQSLVTWFECEECETGQMEAVVKHGETAIPSLIATLRSGSSPASREFLRRQLDLRYTELKAYERTHPAVKVAGTRAEFIEMYLSNFDAQYRVRAATALAAIGGQQAEEALRDALDTSPREDVRATIANALDKTVR